jgi:serine/threonine protein kinase
MHACSPALVLTHACSRTQVLHYYHSDNPPLREHVPLIMRDVAAATTLFVVMPLYPSSLRSFVRERRAADPVAPFAGLDWEWWANVLVRMLRAVDHLGRHHIVHGDIKDDQFFMVGDGTTGEVVLGDFGEAWSTIEDGDRKRLGSRASILELRGGVGIYLAPELRGRTKMPQGVLYLDDLYAKAESWSVGCTIYELLGVARDGADGQLNVFERLCNTKLSASGNDVRGPQEREVENGRYTYTAADKLRIQPGWSYVDDELPPLPDGCPSALAKVLRGLVASDPVARLSAAAAVAMLGPTALFAATDAREAAMVGRGLAEVERDAAVADRDSVIAERDAAVAERDVAVAERDLVMVERDSVMAERDAAVEALAVARHEWGAAGPSSEFHMHTCCHQMFPIVCRLAHLPYCATVSVRSQRHALFAL